MSTASNAPLSILLLEDNPVDARLFAAQVRFGGEKNAQVHVCGEIAEALALLDERSCDVVVLNLGLSDLFGLEGLQRLSSAHPDIAMVVLTGTDDEGIALESLQQGAQDYIVKGAGDGRLLVRSIRHAVERKRHELERERLQSELDRAVRLESLGQLAAGIAHEINTPIQFIGDNTRFLSDAFTDLLRVVDSARGVAQAAPSEDPPDVAWLAEEVPKAIAQTLDGVGRVAAIVRAMKQASHPGGGDKQPVQLNDTLQTAITLSRNEWKYHADVIKELDPALPTVEGLPAELNQVFLNLIVNAAHAIADNTHGSTEHGSPERGTITVVTRVRDEETIEVRVRDTGCGIPETVRARVFDPFFTTKEVGRGTGQGLAIVFNIVTKHHGGAVTFETEVGKGTTFIVTLPRHAPAPAA